jgi:hypothetical protein
VKPINIGDADACCNVLIVLAEAPLMNDMTTITTGTRERPDPLVPGVRRLCGSEAVSGRCPTCVAREKTVFSGIGCSSRLLHGDLRLHDPRPRAGDRNRCEARQP